MKLLLVTQKVDSKDPILGFFHRWIAEFAGKCEHVTVIGQLVDSHSLPDNVTVHSLQKEDGRSTFSQVRCFWHLIHTQRDNYDAVLVHMTPIWMVIGALPWMLMKKRRYLWYEARGTRWPLRVSLLVVRKVFSASVHGMPLETSRSTIVGHGIDTDFFAPDEQGRDARLLLTVGRITAAKRLNVILDAFSKLPEDYRLIIAGNALTQADHDLLVEIKENLHRKGLSNRVTIQSVTQEALQPLLQRANCFLHASVTSLDKAVLEAMASECIVLSTAEAVQPLLMPVCHATETTMTQRILDIANLSPEQRADLAGAQRDKVQTQHSLKRLIERLVEEMTS